MGRWTVGLNTARDTAAFRNRATSFFIFIIFYDFFLKNTPVSMFWKTITLPPFETEVGSQPPFQHIFKNLYFFYEFRWRYNLYEYCSFCQDQICSSNFFIWNHINAQIIYILSRYGIWILHVNIVSIIWVQNEFK
jgi:hypothetical protein